MSGMDGLSRDPVSLRIGTQLPTDHGVSTEGRTEEVRNPPSPERVRKEIGGGRITLKNVAKFFGYAAAASIGAGVVFAALLHPATWACLGAAALFACIAYKGSSGEAGGGGSEAEQMCNKRMSAGHNANIADSLGSEEVPLQASVRKREKVADSEEEVLPHNTERKPSSLVSAEILAAGNEGNEGDGGNTTGSNVQVTVATTEGLETGGHTAGIKRTDQAHVSNSGQVGPLQSEGVLGESELTSANALELSEVSGPSAALVHPAVIGFKAKMERVPNELHAITSRCRPSDGGKPEFPTNADFEAIQNHIRDAKSEAIENAGGDQAVIDIINNDVKALSSQMNMTLQNVEEAITNYKGAISSGSERDVSQIMTKLNIAELGKGARANGTDPSERLENAIAELTAKATEAKAELGKMEGTEDLQNAVDTRTNEAIATIRAFKETVPTLLEGHRTDQVVSGASSEIEGGAVGKILEKVGVDTASLDGGIMDAVTRGTLRQGVEGKIKFLMRRAKPGSGKPLPTDKQLNTLKENIRAVIGKAKEEVSTNPATLGKLEKMLADLESKVEGVRSERNSTIETITSSMGKDLKFDKVVTTTIFGGGKPKIEIPDLSKYSKVEAFFAEQEADLSASGERPSESDVSLKENFQRQLGVVGGALASSLDKIAGDANDRIEQHDVQTRSVVMTARGMIGNPSLSHEEKMAGLGQQRDMMRGIAGETSRIVLGLASKPEGTASSGRATVGSILHSAEQCKTAVRSLRTLSSNAVGVVSSIKDAMDTEVVNERERQLEASTSRSAPERGGFDSSTASSRLKKEAPIAFNPITLTKLRGTEGLPEVTTGGEHFTHYSDGSGSTSPTVSSQMRNRPSTPLPKKSHRAPFGGISVQQPTGGISIPRGAMSPGSTRPSSLPDQINVVNSKNQFVESHDFSSLTSETKNDEKEKVLADLQRKGLFWSQ